MKRYINNSYDYIYKEHKININNNNSPFDKNLLNIRNNLYLTINDIYVKMYKNNIDTFKLRHKLYYITDKYYNNLPDYINENKYIDYKIDNEFTELWEILNNIEIIKKNNTDYTQIFTCYHLYSNSFIDTIKVYLNTHHRKKYKYLHKATNIVNESKDLFLLGKDNTGKLNVNNIEWNNNYIDTWKKQININKIDLITASINPTDDYIKKELNLLLYLYNILLTLDIGGNCIIKSYIPYNYKEPGSEDSYDFYFNFITTIKKYFTNIKLVKPSASRYDDFSIYIVGLNLINNDTKEIKILINKFKPNMTWTDIEPLDMINDINKNTIILAKTKINLLECSQENLKIDNKNCYQILNKKKVMDNNIILFEKWIKNNNLLSKNIVKNYKEELLKIYNPNIFTKLHQKTEMYKYKLNNQKYLKPIKKHTKYHYNELNNIQDKILKLHIYRININNEYNKDNQYGYMNKLITEKYTRGLKNYIHKNKIVDIKISNAYLKLWEILYLIPEIIPKNLKILNTFQMAELPGQFINSITRFIDKHRNINTYNWYANSLKPENLDNLMKYGMDDINIFGDDYNLVKNNPDRWIWGYDGSGDIINTKNIKWYRKFVKDKNINLVTGDGGMDGSVLILQKLDLAQMVLTIATSKKGSSCVIKHFMNYLAGKNDETYHSSGYFMCFLYTYAQYFEYIYITKPATSNPNSGEIYIVGINFKGATDDNIDELCNMLDNYKYNDCWYKKEDIPSDFTQKVLNMMNNIYENLYENLQIRTFLLLCQTRFISCNNNTIINKKNRELLFKNWLIDHSL
jgi:23S rRNA U2552 (ribose-2'-O)-methylase RlmE/FtsJ